jgi:hypothetical protein
MNENQTHTQPSADREVPYTNAVVTLTGKDGNALLILGLVRRGILKSNHPELAEEFMLEAMNGDYDHLLQTCMCYVTVE